MSLTQADIAYQEAHITDDRRYQVVVANVVCAVFATLAVALRFLSRRLANTFLGANYWLILGALIFFFGFIISSSLTTVYGVGRHIILVNNPYELGASFLAAECLYNFIISTIRLLMLYLYRRIFPQPWFKHILMVVGGIVLAYNLVGFLGDILQFISLRHLWDPTVQATCMNYWALIVGTGVINIVTDFVVLALPVYQLWHLHVSRTKRLQLILIFVICGLAWVASIVRLVYAQDIGSVDSTFDDVPVIIVSAVECGADFISACIPTYRILFNRVTSKPDSSAKGGCVSGRITKTTSIKLTNLSTAAPVSQQHRWASLSKGNDDHDDHDDRRALHPNGKQAAFISSGAL